jgi:DNA ligase-1
MIKALDAPYVCKRSDYWLKWKPVYDYDLKIIGVEEGTGRNVGRLGAFVCSGSDNGQDITVNVGSGFSDDDRVQYWSYRDLLPGQTVVVAADAITLNQDGTYSLRFPRFVRFRDDK